MLTEVEKANNWKKPDLILASFEGWGSNKSPEWK